MFENEFWARLGLRDTRYTVPWDALEDPRQRALLDRWMRAADEAGARVLLGFAHSLRSDRLARTLPTRRQFRRQFLRLRDRYPEVRDWLAWNEANHPGSLTARRPARAAQFFDVIARNCRGCRVVAADVLDIRNMTSWIRRFQRAASATPRIWGLHNYGDVNGLRTQGTRRLLAITRGRIWLTETGAVLLRRTHRDGRLQTFRHSPSGAARRTAHALRLGCLSPRITRMYLYHWQAPALVTNWDSALVDPRRSAAPRLSRGPALGGAERDRREPPGARRSVSVNGRRASGSVACSPVTGIRVRCRAMSRTRVCSLSLLTVMLTASAAQAQTPTTPAPPPAPAPAPVARAEDHPPGREGRRPGRRRAHAQAGRREDQGDLRRAPGQEHLGVGRRPPLPADDEGDRLPPGREQDRPPREHRGPQRRPGARRHLPGRRPARDRLPAHAGRRLRGPRRPALDDPPAQRRRPDHGRSGSPRSRRATGARSTPPPCAPPSSRRSPTRPPSACSSRAGRSPSRPSPRPRSPVATRPC